MRTPSPSDHLATLIEFLKPGGPDLVRRWVAALFLAPEEEREGIVSAIEERMALMSAREEEGDGDAEEKSGRVIRVIDPPMQKDGYVEQTTHTYEVLGEESGAEDGPAVVTRGDAAKKGRKADGSRPAG